jgi:glycosyltransferase involved in cell wall biosynthesis
MAKKNKKRAFRNSKSNLAKRESNSTKRDKDVPTVSACMMVKDEEELLPQCLESIKGVVDEIIVVDTGSADRTVEIAKRYGAKVFHHPWENDFSKHRNQSISYATSDWIFIIDADEGLSPESSPKLKQTLLDIAPEVSYLYFEVADMDSQGQMMSAMNSPRLFRNHMGFKFKNFIHNELELKGHGERSNLILFHYGYHLPPEKLKAKFERTTQLLKKRMEEEPHRPEAPFFLCKSYGMEKRSAEAIYYGLMTRQKLEKMGDIPVFFIEIFYIIALSFYRMKMYALAEATCLEGLQLFPKYIDLYFILSDICRISGRFQEALNHSQQYLKLKQFFKENPEQRKSLAFYTLGYHDLIARSLNGIRKLAATEQAAMKEETSLAEQFPKAQGL